MTDEWTKARRERIKHDGRRCRALADDGERCGERTKLTVDHAVSLRELWRTAGLPMDLFMVDWKKTFPYEWGKFVRLATNGRLLMTLCRAHHSQVEAGRRTERRLDDRLAGRRR
jgi:hypothetical protein